MSKKRILIVEDEQIIARDLSDSLERLGYEVLDILTRGEQALEAVERLEPDLILMDIMLGGDIDGVTAAQHIGEKSDLPIIYLTAYADEGTLERAKITKPFGYIIKPFEDRELQSTIEMALYRHGMDRELKRREQWLRTVFKSIGEAVITTDHDLRLTYLNPEAENLLGVTMEEVLGQEIESLCSFRLPETGETLPHPARETLKKERTEHLHDAHLVAPKKEVGGLPVDGNASIIRDETRGETLGVVLVIKNATQRKKMEEALMTSRKQEAVSVLASGIAHDFNNLITAIMGNLALARMFIRPEDKISPRLNEVERASLKARALTTRLLTFARGGGETVRKKTMVAELMQIFSGFILRNSHINCEIDVADDLWPIEIAEGQISQVIHNIVSNAREAMGREGNMWITAHNVSLGAESQVPLPKGDYIKISISDEGTGIPEENLQKIFDPYFTTKASVESHGMGFGLALCYSIVKSHNGLITVDSEVGLGSTFHIWLPAASGEEEKPVEEKEAVGEVKLNTGRSGGRILLLEPEEVVGKTAGEILSHMGYQMDHSQTLDDALNQYRKARSAKTPYNAVIIDSIVEQSSGEQGALAEFKKIDPRIRAILSIGFTSEQENEQTALEAGYKGVISKPFEIDKLSSVLKRILGNRP